MKYSSRGLEGLTADPDLRGLAILLPKPGRPLLLCCVRMVTSQLPCFHRPKQKHDGEV